MPDPMSFLVTRFMDLSGVLEIVAFLESTFGIKIADEGLTLENPNSVNRTAHCVRCKMAAAVSRA